MRLLVIEDNPKMARLIRQGLAEIGHAVDIAMRGEEGETMAITEAYDAIVLDLMLPDEDGIQICRRLRRRGNNTPILMLTALSATTDKVAGLDAGADDYLTKPFEFAELAARIRSLLRRGQAAEASTLRFAGIEMDLLQRRVTRGGRRIKLTPKEFALLEYLLRNPNRLLTRTAIGEHVWDMNFSIESNVIDVYVHTLRRKVDKGFDKRLIHTMIGAGYMLSETHPDD